MLEKIRGGLLVEIYEEAFVDLFREGRRNFRRYYTINSRRNSWKNQKVLQTIREGILGELLLKEKVGILGEISI